MAGGRFAIAKATAMRLMGKEKEGRGFKVDETRQRKVDDTTATSSQTTKRNGGARGGDWAKKNARKGEIPDTSKSRVPPDLRFSDLKIPEYSGDGRSGK